MNRRRARRLLLPLAACAFALVTVSAPATAAPADPAPLLLRLPDLGPGYVVEWPGLSAINHPCLSLLPSTRVMSKLRGHAPFRGCWLSFVRAWTVPGAAPGPESVDSIAFAFNDPPSARSVLAHASSLASRLFGFDTRIWHEAAAPSIGDEAALWRADIDVYGPGLHPHHIAIALVGWRTGSTLGLLLTDGDPRSDASVRTALRLAALQQARIATPTPLRPRVNDDRLVLLDDPGLGAPVMWLGEHLTSSGPFPALRLSNTNDTFDLGEHPQPLVRLIYSTPRLPETAKVELWRPRALRRNLRRPPRPYQCQRRFDVDVPGARAWIEATYLREPRRASGRCPHRGAFITAVAFFDKVGVTIDANGCCRSVVPPYDSRAGLRTLLQALRPRPLPTL